MSLGAINNDYTSQSIWGSQNYSSTEASMGGAGRNTGTSFDETLKDSVGFGSRGESGGVSESIAAASTTGQDLISQIQFSFLKGNDLSGGVDNRLNNALF